MTSFQIRSPHYNEEGGVEVAHNTQSAQILQKYDECNKSCTSSVQVNELPSSHWRVSNNTEGTFFVFLTTYIHI